jgi:DNA topoisomerase-1
MKLVIVESPGKIDSIQKYLGPDYKVLASVGHIVELAKTGEYNLGVDLKKKFETKYVLMQDKVKVLANIMDWTEKCDEVILATDLDQEGEFISYAIYERIKDCGKPISRAVFKEITKKGIAEGMKNIGQINMNQVRAQEARRVLDRIVGFMASPYLSNVFEQKGLSAGRVQSIIVRLVSDKDKEIKAFKPETYWTAQANLTDCTTPFQVKLNRKITEESDAKAVKASLAQAKSFTVIDVQSKIEKKNPPPPLITLTLLQACIRELNFAEDKITKIAQKLYEEGLVTYIRTDAPAISEDALKMLDKYYDDNKIKHPKKHFVYSAVEGSQGAHECIRPSNVEILPTDKTQFTTEDDRKVYDVIWRHFVSCQAEPISYSTLKVVLQLDGTKETFVATGKAIKDKGYLAIMGGGSDAKIDIPNLTKGQVLNIVPKSDAVDKKATKPPPRYNKDTMLDYLKNKSIGRPSSIANLLSKVNDRNYVEMDKNVYKPTELGSKVIDDLVKHFKFMDYDFTARMEVAVDEIKDGKKTYYEVVSSFFKEFKEQLDKAYQDQNTPICPDCGKTLIKRQNKSSGEHFWGCSGFPKCRKVLKEISS